MAAEAEAAREARAKVIAAEGEQKASRALREASEVISESPAALQLRYLQVKLTFDEKRSLSITCRYRDSYCPITVEITLRQLYKRPCIKGFVVSKR